MTPEFAKDSIFWSICCQQLNHNAAQKHSASVQYEWVDCLQVLCYGQTTPNFGMNSCDSIGTVTKKLKKNKIVQFLQHLSTVKVDGCLDLVLYLSLAPFLRYLSNCGSPQVVQPLWFVNYCASWQKVVCQSFQRLHGQLQSHFWKGATEWLQSFKAMQSLILRTVVASTNTHTLLHCKMQCWSMQMKVEKVLPKRTERSPGKYALMMSTWHCEGLKMSKVFLLNIKDKAALTWTIKTVREILRSFCT